MIYIIGDTQSKDKVKNPLIVIAHHICKIKPKFVVHLGDHWDLPSLSVYDKGKKSHRCRSYYTDIKAGNESMQEFWEIIKKEWPEWDNVCEWILLRGNHEERRNRAIEYGPDELIDLMEEFKFDDSNWHEVVPFLTIKTIKGIEFCHYFSNSGSGRPIGTARQLLLKRHVSCVAGHKQGWDYEELPQGGDKMIQSIILGSTYYHKEEYKNHTNNHFRGVVILFNISGKHGFDYARYSLDLLDKKFEVKQ